MISKTGLHSIRALVALASVPEGRSTGAAALAHEIGAPANYLGKLLQNLSRQGLVESQKGLHGGFRLARPAEGIRLLDVIEPIEHVSRWSGCFLGRPVCSAANPCAVHQRWERAREAYLGLLVETTIADILRNPDPVP